MTDIKPEGSYPFVYDSKILNPISHTGTGGETRVFESVKQGGYKKKSRRRLTKYNKNKRRRNNRKTSHKK
jgi:hypothetical protein